MNKITASFLQVGVVLLGIAAVIFMLGEPHLEGRNVDATLFEIYFNDPFLACAYASSILFFVILYQAFKLLGYIAQHTLLSPHTISALRTIRHCATTLVLLIVGAEIYLFTAVRGEDDIAGGVAMGLLLAFIFATTAVFAALFEKRVTQKY